MTSQEIINHNDPVIENVEVLHIISSTSIMSSPESGDTSTRDNKTNTKLTVDQKLVWSFVYPGYYVYQWDADRRVVHGQLLQEVQSEISS